MSQYTFITHWRIPAPVDRVWRELMAPDEWPTWWRGVERVELLRPGLNGDIGAIRRYTWKSRLPYRLTFDMETTRIEPQRVIEGRASGELAGTGRWELTPQENSTRVRYDWSVQTTKAWMRVLSPIARPIFAWNHDIVMAWGLEGLVRRVSTIGAAAPRQAPQTGRT